MNKELIKKAYVSGFMKAANMFSQMGDQAAIRARELLHDTAPMLQNAAKQDGPGLFKSILNPARAHLNRHPVAYGVPALGAIGGSAISIFGDRASQGMQSSGASGAAPVHAGASAGAGGGAGHVDPSMFQQLIESMKSHPYLWGGGAAAGLGLGGLALSEHNKKKQQPEQVPVEPEYE